jgi:Yip1 domain
MTLVDRVRNICLSPASEWPVIEQENTPPAELVVGYLIPLAAIGAVAGFIGSSLLRSILPFGGSVGVGVVVGLIAAIVSFLLTIVGCFVIAFIINALAPTFGGRQDSNQAFKTSVYSYTPGLVAAILTILPILGSLVTIIAGLYGLYLLYLGLPIMMKAPQDKAPAYTIVVILASIVLMLVISMVVGLFAGAGIFGARAF